MIRIPLIAMVGLQLLAALLINQPVTGAESLTAAGPVARAEAPFKPTAVYADLMLVEDTVWRGEVLVEGVLTVAPQATLSIEPGTVVRFRRQGSQAPLLVVQGRLVATGTKEAPVIFTSNFADPAAADWQGIMLLGSEKKNLLENCRIEGAQTGLEAIFSSVTLKNVSSERAATGMRFQDTLVVMEAGGVSQCDIGLIFAGSEATLRNLSVVGNRVGLLAKESSVYLFEANFSGNQSAFSGDACKVKIQGGALVGNGSGITFSGCQGAVTGAQLANNKEFGLSLTASRIRVSANQISGNDTGLIVFDGAAVAWDNAIYDNAGYDLFNAGIEEFRAPANWWGTTAAKIYDNRGRGKVLYAPSLTARPLAPLPQ